MGRSDNHSEGLARLVMGFTPVSMGFTPVSISAASLANRSDLNRVVFSRTARASVSYCALPCAPSWALCAFLNCALAASLELLAKVHLFGGQNYLNIERQDRCNDMADHFTYASSHAWASSNEKEYSWSGTPERILPPSARFMM